MVRCGGGTASVSLFSARQRCHCSRLHDCGTSEQVSGAYADAGNDAICVHAAGRQCKAGLLLSFDPGGSRACCGANFGERKGWWLISSRPFFPLLSSALWDQYQMDEALLALLTMESRPAFVDSATRSAETRIADLQVCFSVFFFFFFFCVLLVSNSIAASFW